MAPPEPARAAETPALGAQLANRHGLIALACVLLLAGLAWWWLTLPMQAAAPMEAMPEMTGMAMPMVAPLDPWSSKYLGTTFTMWAIMMVAMMLPSAAPMIALHQVFSVKRGLGASGTAVFAACYIALWTLFSGAAAVLQAGLVDLGWVGSVSMRSEANRVAALLLALAAIYQISPLKHRCLTACQVPFVFLVGYWQAGLVGSAKMGLRHGLFCIGCCWSLMLLLFVGGVMNLAWIALLAGVVLAEKYAPPAWRLDRVLAVLLLGGAVLLAI
jgi:predicted metal-binding membrane protein